MLLTQTLPEAPVWFSTRAMRGLIESCNDAILITSAHDLDHPGPTILYANPAFYRISGYEEHHVIGSSPRILQGPDTSPNTRKRIRTALEAGVECNEEILNYTRTGAAYWIDLHIVPLLGDDGKIQYFGAIERDVTRRHAEMERLRLLAHQDSLTGLGNRAALRHHLEVASHMPGRSPTMFLLFDLDGFKEINDTLGHLAGDEILRCFATYVGGLLQGRDFMARLGGDEFAVVLEGQSQAHALALANTVVDNMGALAAGGTERVGVSVGLAAIRPGDTLETVMQRADVALYRAKAAGKGAVRVHPGV